MRISTKARVYDERLPAVVVTKDMKDELVSIARKSGESVSETTRRAIAFFLSENYSIAINKDRFAIEESTQ